MSTVFGDTEKKTSSTIDDKVVEEIKAIIADHNENPDVLPVITAWKKFSLS